MFFTISPTIDLRLPCHSKLGNYWLSHDHGWIFEKNQLVKGYWYNQLDHGNFLKIKLLSESTLELEHDRVRGFPLWWDNNNKILTNLLGQGLKLWTNKKILIQDYCLKDSDIPADDQPILNNLTIESAADLMCENLISKAKLLNNQNLPKKIFLTGGVDTTTLYSVLKYIGADVELIDYEYIKYDWFLDKNFKKIQKNHWAYNQCHHWDQPTILVTGSYGDEFLMRGPLTASTWAAWHNIDVINELYNNNNLYHSKYFLKDKNYKVFKHNWENRAKIKQQYKSYSELCHRIIDINCNDFQLWNLGNTITWTPFKDLKLLKLCLSINPDDLTTQILDATLNKLIIQKLYPAALSLISKHKNLI
jgi:hypothetical protein